MRNIKDSQNFLHSTDLVKMLVDSSNIESEDTIIEIGPGKGIITSILDEKCKEVIAIEFDKDLYSELCKSNWKNTNIINEDFLNFEFPSDEKVKIFSNIPFNMTSDIFMKILENNENINDFYLIVQAEAAHMFIGKPYTNESYKSLLFKPIYEGKIIYNFNKTDFTPIPNIDIVMVHFHKKEFCYIKNATMLMYFDFVSYLFNNNNGVNFKEKTKDIFSFEQQKRIRKTLKLEFESKISLWTYEQWIGIFNIYNLYVSDNKKSLVKGSFNKLKKEQNNLDKIHRTRK